MHLKLLGIIVMLWMCMRRYGITGDQAVEKVANRWRWPRLFADYIQIWHCIQMYNELNRSIGIG